jgi:hypothetical protein
VALSIGSTPTWHHKTPEQRVLAELQSEVGSGQISSADSDVLTKSIQSIGSELKAEHDSDAASGDTKKPDKTGLLDKIASLIDGQVSSGSLTADQASELKTVFQSTFEHRHRGGDASSGDAAGAFLKSVAAGSAASYSGSGAATTTDASTSVLLDVES